MTYVKCLRCSKTTIKLIAIIVLQASFLESQLENRRRSTVIIWVPFGIGSTCMELGPRMPSWSFYLASHNPQPSPSCMAGPSRLVSDTSSVKQLIAFHRFPDFGIKMRVSIIIYTNLLSLSLHPQLRISALVRHVIILT